MVIATGSEVSLAAAAAEALDSEGVGVRVVSLPCWELFGAQDADYRDSVLPTGVPRVAVEAGTASRSKPCGSESSGRARRTKSCGSSSSGSTGK